MKKKIAIISLGRLGKSFYNYCKGFNLDVWGTYFHPKSQTPDGQTIKSGFQTIQYDFIQDEIPSQIQDSDVLLFNLTPKVIRSDENFKKFLYAIRTKKLIFISSTSVYGDQDIVDEDCVARPQTENGLLLLRCEELIQKSHLNATIIRPAGIYGKHDHPGMYLAGKHIFSNGHAVVNLISRQELVEIIFKAIDTTIAVINAVNIHHPKKKDYYSEYCLKNNLTPPLFSEDSISKKEHKKEHKQVKTKYKQFEIKSLLP